MMKIESSNAYIEKQTNIINKKKVPTYIETTY